MKNNNLIISQTNIDSFVAIVKNSLKDLDLKLELDKNGKLLIYDVSNNLIMGFHLKEFNL